MIPPLTRRFSGDPSARSAGLIGSSLLAEVCLEPVNRSNRATLIGARKSLPLLQVFHDGLLFLTFLPGSARRSATGDHGSDPRFGHRSCDFLESSSQPGST